LNQRWLVSYKRFGSTELVINYPVQRIAYSMNCNRLWKAWNSGGNSSLLFGFSLWGGSAVECRYTGNARETAFLFQRISVALQRCNVVGLLFCRTRRRAGLLAIPTCHYAYAVSTKNKAKLLFSLASSNRERRNHGRLIRGTTEILPVMFFKSPTPGIILTYWTTNASQNVLKMSSASPSWRKQRDEDRDEDIIDRWMQRKSNAPGFSFD